MTEEAVVKERKDFVWRIGVMRFGLIVAALCITEDLFSKANGSDITWADFIVDVVLNLLVWGLLGGYIFGRLMWYFGARRKVGPT